MLSLDLSFCPNRSLDSFETIKDINLFARKLLLKSLYNKKTTATHEVAPNLRAGDFRSLRDLNLLLQESGFAEEFWEGDLDSEGSEEEQVESSKNKKTTRKFKRKIA